MRALIERQEGHQRDKERRTSHRIAGREAVYRVAQRFLAQLLCERVQSSVRPQSPQRVGQESLLRGSGSLLPHHSRAPRHAIPGVAGPRLVVTARTRPLARRVPHRARWAPTRVQIKGSSGFDQTVWDAAMPTYKGEDGLSDAERRAYAVCNPVSCRHAACRRNLLYASEDVLKKTCGHLFKEWEKCFQEQLRLFTKGQESKPASKT